MEERDMTIYFKRNFDGKSSLSNLSEAVRAYTGHDIRDLGLVREREKKPFFSADGSPHFSISHSNDLWAVVFSDHDVGCDVQHLAGVRSDVKKLAIRFFHPEEASLISRSGDPKTDFRRIWSKKEAAVKLAGSGIDGGFGKFSCLDEPFILNGKSVHTRMYDLPCPGATDGEESVPCFVCSYTEADFGSVAVMEL